MVFTSMTAFVRVRDGVVDPALGARLALGAACPGACPRSVVVEFARGHRYRVIATTHADSGLIVRKSAAAPVPPAAARSGTVHEA